MVFCCRKWLIKRSLPCPGTAALWGSGTGVSWHPAREGLSGVGGSAELFSATLLTMLRCPVYREPCGNNHHVDVHSGRSSKPGSFVCVIKARLSCLGIQHQCQTNKGRARSCADSLNSLDYSWYQLTSSSTTALNWSVWEAVWLWEKSHYVMVAELSWGLWYGQHEK